jgi:hypothetical protein
MILDSFGKPVLQTAPPSSDATQLGSYHTDYDSGDSHSSLELFRESPAKYAAIRVHRTMNADPPTPAMKVGSALHALLFEYDSECKFAVARKLPPKSRAALWVDPLKAQHAKTSLTQAQANLLWGMFVAIANEPDAWNLLVEQDGLNERIFTGLDATGKPILKCKPDRLLKNGLVVDLKTVDGPVDPSSWSRCLAKWGYHRQAAFYLDVLELAGQKADKFIFVAVSKDPPHEIGIYLIDEESVEQGRRENKELLERLAECRRTGIWKHEWQGKVLTAGVPRWALDK